MKGNAYTGEVMVETAGGPVPLRFDWRAIGALRSHLGDEWETRMQEALINLDAERLAMILEIGSGKPADWWLQMSPPFMPTADAVQRAIGVAFFGPGAPERNPMKARALLTRLQRALKLGAGSAGNPANSGA